MRGNGVIDEGLLVFFVVKPPDIVKCGENVPVIAVGVLDFAVRDSSLFRSTTRGSNLGAGGMRGTAG